MGIVGSLMVKDEAHILERAITSLRGVAHTIVVSDTGSTDGTQTWARELGAVVYENAWVDFGVGRTEALFLAAAHAREGDYVLMLDADQEVRLTGMIPVLTAPAYWVAVAGEGHWLPRLTRADLPWRYVGATHEYLDGSEVGATRLDTLSLVHHIDGSRRPVKFQDDLALLKRQVEEHPDDARAVFYLANTLRDLGQYHEASFWYLKRTLMGGWEEERAFAAEQLKRLMRGDTTSVGVPTPALI